MKKITLEDIVTEVCTEFVKNNKDILQKCSKKGFIPYLKLNRDKKKKLASKLLDEMRILSKQRFVLKKIIGPDDLLVMRELHNAKGL